MPTPTEAGDDAGPPTIAGPIGQADTGNGNSGRKGDTAIAGTANSATDDSDKSALSTGSSSRGVPVEGTRRVDSPAPSLQPATTTAAATTATQLLVPRRPESGSASLMNNLPQVMSQVPLRIRAQPAVAVTAAASATSAFRRRQQNGRSPSPTAAPPMTPRRRSNNDGNNDVDNDENGDGDDGRAFSGGGSDDDDDVDNGDKSASDIASASAPRAASASGSGATSVASAAGRASAVASRTPSGSAQPRARAHRTANWTEEETKMMLQRRRDYENAFANHKVKTSRLWATIAEEVNTTFRTSYDGSQCRERFNNVKRTVQVRFDASNALASSSSLHPRACSVTKSLTCGVP